MGKKKNKKNKPVAKIAEEVKNETISSTNTNNIGYTGVIKIGLQHNGKIVKQNIYHNAGSIYLFEFLSKCVGGQCSNNDVPKFIKLFTFNSTDIPSSENIPAGIVEASLPVGGAIAYNTVAFETSTSNGGSAKATLHFTVPGRTCTKNVNNIVSIYQMGLYSATHESEKTEYSAAFNLVNGTSWDPLEFNITNGEYNIYIEWALNFSNAN